MALKKTTLQVLSGIAAIGLTLGIAAPATAEGGGAKDLLVDNVHNLVGGGVNIHADNTCVDKVGDTAHVKFEVQHQPLLRPTATETSTLDDGYIALPKNLKNVKIGVKALADTGTTADKGEEGGDPARPRPMIYDNPVDVPIKDNNDDNPLRGEHELDPSLIPVLGGSYPTKYVGGDPDPQLRLYKDRGFSKKEEPDPTDPNKVITHYLPNEQELRDHIKDYDIHIRKVDPLDEDINYEGPFVRDADGGAWYGNNIKDYDVYVFGNIFMPATFEIEADVDVEHDDTFVTAAVTNLGNITKDMSYVSYQGFALDNKNASSWSRPGYLPPAIPSDPDMIETYKNSLSDAGLDISPRIAPTAEIPGNLRYLRIGNDIHPSTRGDVAEHATKRFDLFGNKTVTFHGQVPSSGEDGADITAAHVTLCPAGDTPGLPGDKETPETETPETETPETETPETETPETETPETETPETETPETETPETETPETETPETETPETETPETETPETEVPNTDTPDTETPETGTPNTDTPETDVPETETPDTETPETETPVEETPETETPESETPETENPQRALATTGASVIGITVVALVLLAGGIFLARRKKQ